MLYKQSD